MYRIITLSDPECCAKPTIYAAMLEHKNASALRRHVVKAFSEANVEIDDGEIDELVDLLYENDYAWHGERFLLEVTCLNETTDERSGNEA